MSTSLRPVVLAVSLLLVTALGASAAVFPNVVTNGGFELPDEPATIYKTPANWTNSFASVNAPNNGVLISEGGGFVGPPAPEGTQAVVLQTTVQDLIAAGVKQDVTLNASTGYFLNYQVAKSVLTPTPPGNYTITLDGTPIASGTLLVAGVYTPFTTTFFNSVGGTHSLSLNNVTAGIDMFIAFDAVSVSEIPEPSAIALLGAGLLTVVRRRQRRHLGTR